MEDTDAVAAIAHDMRTPLAIILGLCDRLEDGDLEAQAAADVSRVKANAELLARDFERLITMPTGKTTPAAPPAAVDLTMLTWNVTANLRVLARARGQELRVPTAPPATVLGSEDDMRSVVSNLVANALRHAPDGGLVRCSVSLRGNRVRLEVADDGPGIPAAERASVLKPYQRGTSATDGDNGHGLGLAIVGRIVDEHHGRLSIGTAPEGGALVTVELPALAGGSTRRHRSRRGGAARSGGGGGGGGGRRSL